jgi:hypothetical protein
MKKITLALVVVCTVSMLSSCGSSPYKKRKACKGNGSWSGNRNLGAVDKMQTTPQKTNTYVWTTKEVQLENI